MMDPAWIHEGSPASLMLITAGKATSERLDH